MNFYLFSLFSKLSSIALKYLWLLFACLLSLCPWSVTFCKFTRIVITHVNEAYYSMIFIEKKVCVALIVRLKYILKITPSLIKIATCIIVNREKSFSVSFNNVTLLEIQWNCFRFQGWAKTVDYGMHSIYYSFT